jgi:hypothetical protein
MGTVYTYTDLFGLTNKETRVSRLPRGYCYLALVHKSERRACAMALGPKPNFESLRPWVKASNTAAFRQVNIRATRGLVMHASFARKVSFAQLARFSAWFSGSKTAFPPGSLLGFDERRGSVESLPHPPREQVPHADIRRDEWVSLDSLESPSDDCPGFEIYDEEFDYLHLFKLEKRHEIALMLGRSPQVDFLFRLSKSLAHRFVGSVHVSSVDSTVVYLGPGDIDVWDALKKFRSLANPVTVGSVALKPPPLPIVPGFCYLPLFEFYTQRSMVNRLGPFPTLEQVFGLISVARTSVRGIYALSHRTSGFWHFTEQERADFAWDQLGHMVTICPQQLLGGVLDEVRDTFGRYLAPECETVPTTPIRESSDAEGFNDGPIPLIITTFSSPTRRSPSFAGQNLSQEEMVNLSPVCEDGSPSMDVPGKVTERFEVGYCYLGLFFPSNRQEARRFFGPNPRISELLKTPDENRYPAVGVITSTPLGRADYHVSFELLGSNVWRELPRLVFESPEGTLGAEEVVAVDPTRPIVEARPPVDWEVFFNTTYRRTYFVFSRLAVCFMFAMFLRGLFVDWLQTYFTLLVVFISLMSALLFDVLFNRISLNVLHLLPGQVSTFAVSSVQMLELASSNDPLLFVVFALGRFVQLVISCVVLWRHVLAVTGACVWIKQVVVWSITTMLDSTNRMLSRRTYQSDNSHMDKWLKTLLQLLASLLRALALGAQKPRDRIALGKLATSISTIASSVDLPKSLKSLWEVIDDRVGSAVSGDDYVPAEGLDLPASSFTQAEISEMAVPLVDTTDRTFQADDGFRFPHIRHLVTKGNISTIAEKIQSAPDAHVHIITAATGTGKSTAIPYYVASTIRSDVYVVIPTIAACRSAAQVVSDRFGVQPHVKADSLYTAGNCNIWIVTAKTMVAKMVHQPDATKKIGAFVFDEMHEPTAENDLFRKLSPMLAKYSKVLWCSATFSQSFTLPGDLMHPVVERIDRSVSLENIFTDKCKVAGATRSSVHGRYLVFCASVRDTERVVRKFKGSRIKVFSVHSGNFSTVMPVVEKELKDTSNTTVVVAATPCLETGVTVPLNYVIDLGEQIVPKMTYDPNALSTQRVPITKGSATQRKGRVGRLFRGIYIAPPIRYSSALAIQESGISLSYVYSRLFGVEGPSRNDFRFLTEQVFTDSFLKNVFSTRLDPIAVAGMTTPEGRIFKSFDKFEYPKGADSKGFVFSPEYFPESLWRSWPSFATSEWTQELPEENRTQVGKSVRAPFWDYTVDDKVQIENWQLKVMCYRGKELTDPSYSQANYMRTTIADALAKSWLYQGTRSFQSDNDGDDSYRPASVSEDFESTDSFETAPEESHETPHNGERERRQHRSAVVWGSTPGWVYWRTLAEADWTFLLAVWLVVILFWFLVFYSVRKTIHFFTTPKVAALAALEEAREELRVYEKEVKTTNPLAVRKANRPFERKRRIGRYDISDFDPEEFITVDFEDGRESRRVSREDFEKYIDDWLEYGDRAGTRWGDDFVTVTARTKSGRYVREQIWESDAPPKRVMESEIGSRAPMYSLRSAKASVVAVGPADSRKIIANAVIVRTFIFVNTHVLKDCGSKMKMQGVRGEFVFQPALIMSEGDLSVIHLPPGVAGSSANFSFRSPELGEQVSLVRFRQSSQNLSEPTPSELSFIAADATGAMGYVINTLPGDCGYPVISSKDGSLLGLHSLGGSHLDQANFMTPITPKLIRELNRRVSQRAEIEPIEMPVPPTPDELHATGIVAPREQAKHAVTPLPSVMPASPFDLDVAGFLNVASLRKHVSKTSRITIDKRAWDIFSGDEVQPLMDLTDYCPSALVMPAYWKDVAKYHRSPLVLPGDFASVALDCFMEMAPWLFEEQELISVSEVYYEVDKTKSSGPRLSQKKGAYMNEDFSPSFPQLVSACEALYDVAPEDFVAPIWQVAIKDELRDKDRVLAMKTRTFMSAPIETILGNMRYVTNFNNRFVDNCLKFPSTLGIDKFHGGWEELALYLGKEDRFYFSGDGARFDSSVGIVHLSINSHLRCQSVAKKHRRHIRNLYSETAFTPLVMGDGFVRVKNSGNPSGSLNTSIDNGISLMASVFYALKEIFGKDKALALLKSGDVRFVTNGDDLFFSVASTVYFDGLVEKIVLGLASTGMTYSFDEPTASLSDHTYLSHSFVEHVHVGQVLTIPVLSSARIVASCLFAHETDAVSTHSRYLSAAIHAFPHKNLFPYVLRLQAIFHREAMLDRSFVTDEYRKRFPIFFPDDIARLYGFNVLGFANKTYSHKNNQQSRRFLERTFQAMSLETEVDDNASMREEAMEAPIEEAAASGDVINRPSFSAPARTAKFQFAKGMDPTIANLFSSAVGMPVRERVIVAKSTRKEIERSVGALRDLLSIDSEPDMHNLLRDLMIYYGDNSTSEQNPHIFKYEWKDTEVSYNDIDRCLLPTPRKFWRALADVVVRFLEEHPDVMFHWAEMHGFPSKYRQYGFDCADFATNVPAEARKAIQASKDAALTRTPYNLMRADLKAVGFGGGTVVEQITGAQFGSRGPGRGR